MTGYALAAPHYLEAGWSPLPLPHGAKWPPPSGYTGDGGAFVAYPDVATWADESPESNVALRLPKNVIGIDVDGYKPRAMETMAHHTTTCGPLPATWRSSSRPDEISGIYFFRVPEDVAQHLRDPRHPTEGSKGSDVEIIRWDHRYAVVAPSLAPPPPKGSGDTYRWFAPDGSSAAPRVDQLPMLPEAWIEALRAVEHVQTEVVSTASAATMSSYEQRAIGGMVERLQAMTTNATGDLSQYRGEPWDNTTLAVAARLTEFANAEWSGVTHEMVKGILFEHAPRDSNFTDVDVSRILESARRKVAGKAATPPTGRVDDSGLFANAPTSAPGTSVGSASAPQVIAHDRTVDVTLPAVAHDWLRQNVGLGHLSGMFSRKGELVFTPKIGDTGYIEPKNARAEGAASISRLDGRSLQARIQARQAVVKMVEKPAGSGVFKAQPAVFPIDVATMMCSAPDDAEGLRELHGVVHAPTFRPDGSLITKPGYDEATGLLFLPTGGQPPAIPEQITYEHLVQATSWLAYMLTDFHFLTDDDRANYIGLLLTPLLRTMTPGPYKLGVIEAHQPGSGKTFLARAITSIHGGLMHAELPIDEPELAKTIASILDAQTAPVVVFDNVTGTVRSPTLAGLLTSPTFQARRLGGNALIEAENDRLWVITGNNASLGGDLARRNIRVRIDPGVPNPELRTRFTIPDFEGWVRQHRGALLWSLTVMVKHWVAQGSPVAEEVRQDSYGRWVSVVQSILSTAGVPGVFDDPAVQQETNDPEAEEWSSFLEAVWEKLGDRDWTAKSLLALVAHPLAVVEDSNKPLSYDVLPSGLYSGRASVEPATLAKSLGRWLLYRSGRWAGQLTVIHTGKNRDGKTWRIKQYGS